MLIIKPDNSVGGRVGLDWGEREETGKEDDRLDMDTPSL